MGLRERCRAGETQRGQSLNKHATQTKQPSTPPLIRNIDPSKNGSGRRYGTKKESVPGPGFRSDPKSRKIISTTEKKV